MEISVRLLYLSLTIDLCTGSGIYSATFHFKKLVQQDRSFSYHSRAFDANFFLHKRQEMLRPRLSDTFLLEVVLDDLGGRPLAMEVVLCAGREEHAVVAERNLDLETGFGLKRIGRDVLSDLTEVPTMSAGDLMASLTLSRMARRLG